MGWNGINTYGVRVDSARVADTVAWSNVSSKPSLIMYYQGFTLDANTMDSNSTGFTYAINAPYVGPIARFSAGGAYDMWLNATYNGGGTQLSFRTFNGDAGTFNSWHRILNTSSDPIPSNMNQYVRTSDTVRFDQARFSQRISIGDGNGTPFLNTGSPGIWLSYNGNSDIFMGAQSSSVWGVYIGSWLLTLNNSGAVTATSFFESSDFRLKSDIKDLDIDVSSIVAKSYLKNGIEEIGYIAQDVESILPSAISKRDDGYLDLSYRQVHTAKIAALEKEVAELKKQLKNK
jgi:hypothetical protein